MQPLHRQPADGLAAERGPLAALLLKHLSQHGASFVQDVLRSHRSGDRDELERAIVSLELQRRVIVRPHSSGDPHLEGADLRIMAAVPEAGDDGIAGALAAIDGVWNTWLAEFLSSHRCN